MASKKQKGRAATAAAPAPAATARPLPEGFERITDDDGDELVQPTPARAVADLLEILRGIPAWERFQDDPGEWTPSQIRERGRPMPGYVLLTGVDEKGKRCHVELGDDSPVVQAWERLEAARCRACGNRDQIDAVEREWGARVSEWEHLSGRRFPVTAPSFKCSPIEERQQMVCGLRTGFVMFVPQAIAAVVAAGGNAAPLRDLERDEVLHADTVVAAVAELRKLVESAGVAPVPAKPTAKTPIDVAHDPVCVTIRKVLATKGPKMLKALVTECRPASRRTIVARLRLLHDAGHAEQSGNRGHHRLTNLGSEQQRRD